MPSALTCPPNSPRGYARSGPITLDAMPCRTSSTWRACRVSQPPWWLVTPSATWTNCPERRQRGDRWSVSWCV